MNAHFLRGQHLIRQGRFDLAVEELRESASLNPDWAPALSMLSLALLRSGCSNEALKAAEGALEKDPADDYAHWMVALIQLERNDLKAAQSSIRKAIELDPQDAENRGLLARVLCERKRFTEGLAAADAGLAIDPANDLCLTYRAHALMGLGRAGEAKQVASKLLEEAPDDAWNHCLRGDQLLAEGDTTGARVHFLEALRISPGNQVARYGLATALKARSPVYGIILKALLQAGRLRTWMAWVAIIFIIFGLRVGDRLAARHTEWMVAYTAAKQLLFGAFIFITIANPVFNLLLRCDREGRHALSADEVKASNWVLPCLGFGALCACWAVAAPQGIMPELFGMASFYLCNAVTEVFDSTPGYVRSRMAVCTATAGALLVIGAAALSTGVVAVMGKQIPALVYLLWVPALVMLFAAGADDLRNWLEKRRPDAVSRSFD